MIPPTVSAPKSHTKADNAPQCRGHPAMPTNAHIRVAWYGKDVISYENCRAEYGAGICGEQMGERSAHCATMPIQRHAITRCSAMLCFRALHLCLYSTLFRMRLLTRYQKVERRKRSGIIMQLIGWEVVHGHKTGPPSHFGSKTRAGAYFIVKSKGVKMLAAP